MIGENIALLSFHWLTVAIQRCRTAARASVTELTHLVLACQQSRPQRRTAVAVDCASSRGYIVGGVGGQIRQSENLRVIGSTASLRPNMQTPQ